MRREIDSNEWLLVIANFTPNFHESYKIGVPLEGFYKEIFNSDGSRYGGSNMGNMGGKETSKYKIHNKGRTKFSKFSWLWCTKLFVFTQSFC